MSWYVYTLLAVMFWTVVNIIDKHLLSDKIKNPLNLFVFFGLISGICSLLIFVFRPVFFTFPDSILALASGLTYSLALLLYYYSLKTGEVSRLIPITYTSPLFVAVMAAFFISEILSIGNYIGIVLIVFGAILVSSKKWSALKFDKSFFLMLAAAVFFAVYDIFNKYLTNTYNFLNIFAYIALGVAIAALVVLLFKHKELLGNIRKMQKTTLLMVLTTNLFNTIGICCFIIAISTGAVTLASGLSAIQPFIVLFMAVFLTKFFPNIIKEEIDRKTLAKKFLAILLVVIGTILII